MASYDDSSCSKTILDYYEKYSHNSNLSKYFSGSSIQCLPASESSNTGHESLITELPVDKLDTCESKLYSQNIQEGRKESANENSLNSGLYGSPVHSPPDNKKLEWDSGADIGYHVPQHTVEEKFLRKSVSLPIIKNLTAIEKLLSAPDINTKNIDNDLKKFICSSTSDISDNTSLKQALTKSTNSVSDVTADDHTQQGYISNADSSSNSSVLCKTRSGQEFSTSESAESNLLEFKRTLSYLKEKIGLPGAHSTPTIQSNNVDYKTSTNILNKKDLCSKGVKSVGSTHTDNFVIVQRLVEKNKNQQISDQPLFTPGNVEKVPFSSMNTEESDSFPKHLLKRLKKRVIELTISKPISIDLACSEFDMGDKAVKKCKGSTLEPKGVQTKDIKLNNKEKSSNTDKDQSFSHDNNVNQVLKNSHKDYSDCSANCDSFEYIGNAKPGRQEDTSEYSRLALRNTSSSSIIDSPKFVTGSSVESRNYSQPKETSLSNISKSSSDDVEKHVELLKKLLKSKKINLQKKKYYIKKLIDDISSFHCLESHAGSGSFCSNNDNCKKDCSAVRKGSTKGSKNCPVEQHSTSGSGRSCVVYLNEDKTESKYNAANYADSDYLVQFAENERAYQINWIDNEISHLSKLKTILQDNDLKKLSKSKVHQTLFQKQPLKASVYRIMQQDQEGISKDSERKYVIETKLGESSDQKISYSLHGKKYSITDCTEPISNKNTNENFGKNFVTADLKVKAEEKQTNIKVSTSCPIRKQGSCVDELNTPENNFPRSTTDWLWSLPHTNDPKLCSSCQKVKCDCQETERVASMLRMEQDFLKTKNNSNSPSEPPVILESFNSLEKIFQKCCCTVENRVCNCYFVKKLFNRLLPNANIPFTNGDLAFKDNESQTSPLSYNTKKPHLQNEFQIDKIQDSLGSNVNIPSPCNPDLVRTKTIQTTEVFKMGLVEQFNTETGRNQIVNNEEYLFTGKDESPGKKQLLGNNGFNSYDINKMQNQNGDTKEFGSADIKRNKETVTDLNCSTMARDSLHKETVNGKTVLTKIGHSNKEVVAGSTDSSLNSVSNTNIKCRDVGVQVSYNFSAKIKHPNKLTKIIDNESVVRTDDETLNSTSKFNAKSGNIGIQDSVKSVTKIEDPSTQQNEITSKEGGLLEDKINAVFEVDAKYKEIGVQAIVDLKNYSSQTSDQYINEEWYAKRYPPVRSNFGNVKIGIGHIDDRNTNSPKKKNLRTSNKPNNVNVKMDTKSEILCSERLKEVNKHPVIQTTASNEDITSDGTFANYSQAGSTSASISTSVFDSRSIPPTRLICVCCRKNAFVAETTYIHHKNCAYAICSRCYCNKPIYAVCDLDHRQRCAKLMEEESEQTPHSVQFCNCCKRKLRKSSNISKGIAYNLAIGELPANKLKKQFVEPSMKDIIIVETGENKENEHKNGNNPRGHRPRNDKPKTRDNKNAEISPSGQSEGNKMEYTLTEYLIMNRPEFIYSAENRRQSVLNSRILREHQKDILKLQFLENNLHPNGHKGPCKLFTEREMKDINKRNYQRLPENQKKLIQFRETRLRDADKLICDKFAKKVQKSALKGKWNFPIDKTLTDL